MSSSFRNSYWYFNIKVQTLQTCFFILLRRYKVLVFVENRSVLTRPWLLGPSVYAAASAKYEVFRLSTESWKLVLRAS